MGAMSIFRWRRNEDVMFWAQRNRCYLGYGNCSTKELKRIGIFPPENRNRMHVQNVLAFFFVVVESRTVDKIKKDAINYITEFSNNLTYLYLP
jgi:hypothetical protein